MVCVCISDNIYDFSPRPIIDNVFIRMYLICVCGLIALYENYYHYRMRCGELLSLYDNK